MGGRGPGPRGHFIIPHDPSLLSPNPIQSQSQKSPHYSRLKKRKIHATGTDGSRAEPTGFFLLWYTHVCIYVYIASRIRVLLYILLEQRKKIPLHFSLPFFDGSVFFCVCVFDNMLRGQGHGAIEGWGHPPSVPCAPHISTLANLLSFPFPMVGFTCLRTRRAWRLRSTSSLISLRRV